MPMFWWQELEVGWGSREQRVGKVQEALLLYSTSFLLPAFLILLIKILAILQGPILHVCDIPGPPAWFDLLTH